MAVDDSYYPYKQPGSVPFNWEIRPGVPKHNQNPHCPQQHTTRPANRPVSSPKLKPPPPVSLIHPLEEPRTRSFLTAPRTRSILSSSPRTQSHSQRITSTPHRSLLGQPDLVGPGCFPSPTKQDRMSGGRGRNTGRSKKMESEFGFEFGPDYASDLEMLVRWSTTISSMRKSNAAFNKSSSDDSSQSSNSPISHAECAALNLF